MQRDRQSQCSVDAKNSVGNLFNDYLSRLLREHDITLEELYTNCTINMSFSEFKRHAAGHADLLRGEFTRCVTHELGLSQAAEAQLVLSYLGVGRYSDP